MEGGPKSKHTSISLSFDMNRGYYDFPGGHKGENKTSNEHINYIWILYKEIKNNLNKLFISGILECAKIYFK